MPDEDALSRRVKMSFCRLRRKLMKIYTRETSISLLRNINKQITKPNVKIHTEIVAAL